MTKLIKFDTLITRSHMIILLLLALATPAHAETTQGGTFLTLDNQPNAPGCKGYYHVTLSDHGGSQYIYGISPSLITKAKTLVGKNVSLSYEPQGFLADLNPCTPSELITSIQAVN